LNKQRENKSKLENCKVIKQCKPQRKKKYHVRIEAVVPSDKQREKLGGVENDQKSLRPLCDTKFFESETKSTNIGTGPLGND
jgi:hypothetical protein